jgi:hypothetical protein
MIIAAGSSKWGCIIWSIRLWIKLFVVFLVFLRFGKSIITFCTEKKRS